MGILYDGIENPETGQDEEFVGSVLFQYDDERFPSLKSWLICNGMQAGRWTGCFGANCIADTQDCLNILKGIKEHLKLPDENIVEYSIKKL